MQKIFKQDEQAVNQVYARIFENLDKLRLGNTNSAQVQYLLNDILHVDVLQGYYEYVPNIYVASLYGDANTSKIAQFESGNLGLSKRIVVSIKHVQDCIEGRLSFATLVDAIGHENTHSLQNEVELRNKDLFKNVFKGYKGKDKKKAQSFLENLNRGTKELTSQQVSDIYVLLKNLFGADYVKKVEGLNKQDRDDFLRSIAYSQYIGKQYEEDARVGGLYFAYRKLSELYEHPLCDSYIKDWLAPMKKDLEKMVQAEKVNRQNYDIFKEFEAQLKSIDMQALGNFEQQVIQRGGGFTDWRKNSEFENASREVFITALDIIFNDKTPEELMQLYKIALKSGWETIAYRIDDKLHNNPEYIKEYKSKFSSRICDMLLNEDCPPQAYQREKYCLEDGHLQKLIEQLFAKNKFRCAKDMLLHNKDRYFLNEEKSDKWNAALVKTVINATKDYASRMMKGMDANASGLNMQDIYNLYQFINCDLLDEENEFGIKNHTGYIEYISPKGKIKLAQLAQTLKPYSLRAKSVIDEVHGGDIDWQSVADIYGANYARASRENLDDFVDRVMAEKQQKQQKDIVEKWKQNIVNGPKLLTEKSDDEATY